MSLGFGLLSAQIPPGAAPTWDETYARVLEYTELAERLGFASVWTTEHHFVDDGYMPSLLVTSAAMAARTSRIEIGTGVLLAPLHHPLRLAEDAATVQLVSGGRLALGLGLGWVEPEFAALGVPMRLRGQAMTEILELLPKAWTGQPFTHSGTVYDFPTVGVRPTPHRPIPILIGGGAEPAVRRAARLADGFFSNATPERFAEQVRWANDEMETIGRDPATFRWIYYSIIYPCDDPAAGWDEARDHIWAMTWKYSDMAASASRPLPPPAPPPFPAQAEERVRGRTVIVDTAKTIVERIAQIRAAARVDAEIVARSYLPTLPHERQVELMQRLAEEVAPHI